MTGIRGHPGLPDVVSRSDALSSGVTARQLRGRTLERVRRCVYRRVGAEPDFPAEIRALARELPPEAVFSGATAAALLGLPMLYSSTARTAVELTVPPHRRRPVQLGVRAHAGNLPSGDVIEVAGIWITAPARTFLDLAAYLTLEDLVALGDAMLHRGMVDTTILAAKLDGAAGRRGVRTARSALPLLDRRSQSVPESVMRVRIGAAGLPLPTPQLAVWDGDLLVAHVDLGYDQQFIAIEYDGRLHADPAQYRRDIYRYRSLTTLGWRVLRLCDGDLAGESRRFLTQLAVLLDVPCAALIHRETTTAGLAT